jgi:hypothetical protein
VLPFALAYAAQNRSITPLTGAPNRQIKRISLIADHNIALTFAGDLRLPIGRTDARELSQSTGQRFEFKPANAQCLRRIFECETLGLQISVMHWPR